MSHQPFESWLLTQDGLTQEQAANLQAHLVECEVCAALAVALGEVESKLRSAEPLRPAPGFTARWHARSERAAERRSARQVWLALALSIGLAVLLLALLVLGVMASPGDWAARGLRTVAGWIADVRLAWSLVGAFLGSLPEPVSLASGIGLGLGLMLVLVGLAAAWFITVHRFAFPVHRGGVRR